MRRILLVYRIRGPPPTEERSAPAGLSSWATWGRVARSASGIRCSIDSPRPRSSFAAIWWTASA